MTSIKIENIQIKRGTNSILSQQVLLDGELAYKKDSNSLVIGDGKTMGGLTLFGNDSNKKTFNHTIFKNGRNGSGTWYDFIQAHNFTRASGSWKGWVKSNPLNIPYNCKITELFVNFREVMFDWRSSPGSIFLDIGIFDHNYNSSFNERILRFEISGGYTGNTIGDSGFRFNIFENKITNMLGNNLFYKGELVGFLLRASTSVPGRIYNITDAYHSITFESI